MRQHFAKPEEGELINFNRFLNRFQIQCSKKIFDKWNHYVIFKICEKIFEKFNESGAFLEFDKGHEGKISYESFLSTLKSFNVDLSENQIYDLMTSMDENGDGKKKKIHIFFFLNFFFNFFNLIFFFFSKASLILKNSKRDST